MWRSIAFFTAVALSAPVAAQTGFPDAKLLNDAALAEARGGFVLPNGWEIALSVRQDTSINGALLLRTYYTVDQGPAQVQILVGGNQPLANGGNGAANTDYAQTQVNISTGNGAGAVSDDGLTVLRLDQGSDVQLGNDASVAHTAFGNSEAVTLAVSGTEVSHLMGNTLGTVVSNTANDRAINTTTTIDLDLSAIPDGFIGGLLPSLDNIASEALTIGVE